MRTVLSSFLLVVLMSVAPARADHCFDYASDGTGVWQITDGTPEHTVYVDDHGYAYGNGTWLYTESNGEWEPKLPGVYHAAHWWSQPDLQVGGCEAIVPECGFEWFSCDGIWNEPVGPDQLVF